MPFANCVSAACAAFGRAIGVVKRPEVFAYRDEGEAILDWRNVLTVSLGRNSGSLCVGSPAAGLGFVWQRGKGFTRV